MFIDSHTHLDHCREEPEALVADAARAGVGLIIQSGIDLKRSQRSVAMADRLPQVFATVGFHPQEAGLLDDEGRAGLEGLVRHPRVVGVGETGFDFYHDNWPHDVQEDTFLYHLDLARRTDLPVVIHTRDAAERTLAVLADAAVGLTVILHCFSLPDRLDEVVGHGHYISFAGNVTYKNATDLQAAAAAVPADQLLFETDAPWLTPALLRGRPNRPALVAAVYEFVAALRGVEVEALARQVEENVLRAFPRVAAARAAARAAAADHGRPSGGSEPGRP
jgi:TatD DNase family protein